MNNEYWRYIVAPQTVPITEEAFSKQDNTRVYWLGAAGFMINARGSILFIDPVLGMMADNDHISESGNKLKIDLPISADAVSHADAVLYTHTDEDHMGRNTALMLNKLKPLYIGPPLVAMALMKMRIDPDCVEMCRTGSHYNVKDVEIDVMPADHGPWQLMDKKKYGTVFRNYDCNGFVLTTPDMKAYFPGDTRIMEEHELVPQVDLLALDSSMGIFHLSYAGAVIMANLQKNALLLPCHYGTIDSPSDWSHCGCPEDYIDEVDGGPERLRKIAPGECVAMKCHKEITL